MLPFYDPHLSYEDNYAHGPWGAFADAGESDPEPASGRTSSGASGHQDAVLGQAVNSRFGIPAGPLLNARFCAAAFAHGFDINVYKTVRSRQWVAHSHPHVLAVHTNGPLTLDQAGNAVVATNVFDAPPGALSITNSFGVPSAHPDVWQPDMAAAVGAAGPGEVLVGSFQGSYAEHGASTAAYVADHALTARLVAETGARVLEMNLSCPNEGSAALLCFDTPLVVKVLEAVRESIGDLPLVVKMAYFASDAALATFVEATAPWVDGYAAINTIPARLVDPHGRQALLGAGREVGGVCGEAIGWAALDMVTRLAQLRDAGHHQRAIIGVGGAGTPERYLALRGAGADVVMSATGAMFDPTLARRVKNLAPAS